MGCFSWMYADKNNETNMVIGDEAFLLMPDGNHIKEEEYNGYGVFHGKDVYDVVVDLNRKHLSKEYLREPKREVWGDGDVNEKYYENAKKSYEEKGAFLEYIKTHTDEECEKYAEEHNICYSISSCSRPKREWKRSIGIDIACYDEQNEKLPFPIKIASKPVDYNSVPASHSDDNQGFYRVLPVDMCAFENFLRVQAQGNYNMVSESARMAAGLTTEEHRYILNNYEYLEKEYDMNVDQFYDEYADRDEEEDY